MPGVDTRILVSGAGVTGGEVLNRLAAADLKARALVRNPARAETFRRLGIELVEGVFARESDWRRALDGASRVFLINTADRDAVAWHAAFLAAAKESRVEHVVQLSGMSACLRRAAPPPGPGGAGTDHPRCWLGAFRVLRQHLRSLRCCRERARGPSFLLVRGCRPAAHYPLPDGRFLRGCRKSSSAKLRRASIDEGGPRWLWLARVKDCGQPCTVWRRRVRVSR